MTRDEILEAMKVVREAEDSFAECQKSLQVFDDSKNWNPRYTDDQSRIDKFDFLGLDPRQIAYTGAREADKAIERLKEYWDKLREREWALKKAEQSEPANGPKTLVTWEDGYCAHITPGAQRWRRNCCPTCAAKPGVEHGKK